MKALFDLRSFLIGAVLTGFVLLALGAVVDDSPQLGRFDLETTANHVVVLDTATGQVWGEYVIPRQEMKDQELMNPRLSLLKK